jgi:hypothetical protein
MTIEINSNITPALHPTNLEKLDGIDEETLPVISHAVAAFQEAYQGISQVQTAREAARSNPAWTEAQQIMATADLSDKMFERIAKRMDSSRASLEAGIAHLEKEMMQPVESRASHPVSIEVRSYIRNLPSADRMSFIKRAIETGDHETAQAALGAPSYLSGIEPEMQKALLRLYREKASPASAKRLKALASAKEYIEKNGSLVIKELEKSVGLPAHKVQQLRNAKSKAEQAFVLKDVA